MLAVVKNEQQYPEHGILSIILNAYEIGRDHIHWAFTLLGRSLFSKLYVVLIFESLLISYWKDDFLSKTFSRREISTTGGKRDVLCLFVYPRIN